MVSQRLLLLASLFVAACGSSASKPAADSPQPPPPEATPADAAPAVSAEAQAADQLAWVIETINAGAPVATEAVTERFSPSFLAKVPGEQVVTIFAQLAKQLAPLAAGKVEAKGASLTARYSSAAGPVKIDLSVEESGKIAGLLVGPDRGSVEAPKTWEGVDEKLAAAGASSQLLVASVDRGRCKPIRAIGADKSLAIGSTFKLYVLYALAQRIAAGGLDWDTKIAIRDDWKSLPSGTMQSLDAGTEQSVREYAEKMISISDNTATDHLLYTLGRKRVEGALKAAGHSAPKKNVPFLGTRELFVLKLGLSDEERAAFVAMKPAARRRYLEREVPAKKVVLADAQGWDEPKLIEELEWFASAQDLCRSMASLRKLGGSKKKLAPLFEVLAKNPGLAIDDNQFPYVGFKGGSEPGVLNLAFLVRHASGDWYSVIVAVNDPAAAIKEGEALAAAQGVFHLLAEEAAAKTKTGKAGR